MLRGLQFALIGSLVSAVSCQQKAKPSPSPIATVRELPSAEVGGTDSKEEGETDLLLVVAGGTSSLDLPSDYFVDIRIIPHGSQDPADEVQPTTCEGMLSNSATTTFSFRCEPGKYSLHVVIGRRFAGRQTAEQDVDGEVVEVTVNSIGRASAYLLEMDREAVRSTVDRLAQMTVEKIKPPYKYGSVSECGR